MSAEWSTRRGVRSAIVGNCYIQVRRESIAGMKRKVYFWIVLKGRSGNPTVVQSGSVARKPPGDKRTYYEIAQSEAVAACPRGRKNPAFGDSYWTPAQRMRAATVARSEIAKLRDGGTRPSLRENRSYPRIRRMMLGKVKSVRTIGIFTAHNPQAKRRDRLWNKRANERLMAWLRKKGYGPIPIGGMYGIEEHSYLVPNITKKDTVDAGLRFDQQSVIWASRRFRPTRSGRREAMMVWQYIEGTETTQTRDVSLGGKIIDDREDNYSIVRGRKFVIPFFDDSYENARLRRRKKRRNAPNRDVLRPVVPGPPRSEKSAPKPKKASAKSAQKVRGSTRKQSGASKKGSKAKKTAKKRSGGLVYRPRVHTVDGTKRPRVYLAEGSEAAMLTRKLKAVRAQMKKQMREEAAKARKIEQTR